MSDKILVTSRSALIEEYGKKGFDDIARAVQALAMADKGRGYVARLIFPDDPKTMRRCRGTAVTDIKSGQQHKDSAICLFIKLAGTRAITAAHAASGYRSDTPTKTCRMQ
jgi:hypothetical protein